MGDFDFDQIVGSNVGIYRTARGLSQSGLAAAMSADGDHVHPQTIQKIEAGTRPLRYAEALRIARVLEIGVDELAAPSGVGVAATVATTQKARNELTWAALELGKELGKLACAVHADEGTRVSDALLQCDWAAEVENAMLDAIALNHTTYGATVRDALQWLVEHGSGDEDDDAET